MLEQIVEKNNGVLEGDAREEAVELAKQTKAHSKPLQAKALKPSAGSNEIATGSSAQCSAHTTELVVPNLSINFRSLGLNVYPIACLGL